MVELGNEIKVGDVFKEGDFVDAIGTSKGKGFKVSLASWFWWCWTSCTRFQHNK